ncbi:hypothetical protein QFZ97_007857 [Paraburkholderia youngii]
MVCNVASTISIVNGNHCHVSAAATAHSAVDGFAINELTG